MTYLQIGDYVRHKDLTLDQYLTFTRKARLAGFRIDYETPERRYEVWLYTVLCKNHQQCGKDSEPTKPNHRDVTHHFNNNNDQKNPNVDGPLRNALIAQGWVPPTVTPKEQWLADAVEETNCEALSAEVLYDAMKSGRLSTP